MNFFVVLLIILLMISGESFSLEASKGSKVAQFKNRDTFIEPRDLRLVPQNIDIFLDNYNFNDKKNSVSDRKIEKRFRYLITEPWRLKFKIDDVKKYNSSIFSSIASCYNNNYKLYKHKEVQDLIYSANNFKLINRRAIVVNSSNLRALPSNASCYHPDKAGGSYPFDDFQHSLIYKNSPVYVLASSNDRMWYLVSSHEKSMGWVRSQDIGFIRFTDKFLLNYQRLALPLIDDLDFRIGMFFPIYKIINDDKMVIFIPKKYKDFIRWEKVLVEKTKFGTFEDVFNKNRVRVVLKNLMNKPYGWGGIDNKRDCSSTLRDYFTTIGLYLPRNSKSQIDFEDSVNSLSIKNLNSNEKIDIIKKNGVPFRTLVYMPGHIMLYIGIYNDNVMVFHNIWGQKITKNNSEGRNIIGHSVLSTLELGKDINIVDKNKLILSRITKIATF